MWSTGCVLAELLLGQPLFAGDSAIDQLVEIIKVAIEIVFVLRLFISLLVFRFYYFHLAVAYSLYLMPRYWARRVARTCLR
jgi:hypothetical protein